MAMAEMSSLFDPDGLADTRNCLRLILGRQALSHHEIRFYRDVSTAERICRMVENMEFSVEVEAPISLIGFATASRFMGEPSQRFLEWVKSAIPLDESSQRQLDDVIGWRELLITVWSDRNFLNLFQDSAMSGPRIQLFLDGLRRISPERGQSLSRRFSCNLRTLEDNLNLITVGTSAAATEQPDLPEMTYYIREMIRIKPWQKGFVATEDDPQLIFPSLAIGLYHFRMRIVFEHTTPNTDLDYTQLFFDFGEHYTEKHSLKFPIADNTVTVNGVLDVRRPVKSIRLDPTIGAADFRFEYLRLNLIH